MPWEPEWGYLDELLALLGPSPDMKVVEFRFYRALDEGVLQDRARTPSEFWHERFENGVVCALWGSRTMLVPWFDRGWREWRVKEICPQFRRAAWLELFSDLIPAALKRSAEDRSGAAEPAAKRGMARVTQKTVEEWMNDEWFEQLNETGRQPTHAAALEAAQDKFGDKVTRKTARAALTALRPELKPGPRGPRK